MCRNKFNKKSASLLHWKLQNIVKEELNKWKDILYSWIRRFNNVKMAVFPKLIYRFSPIPIIIPAAFFKEIKN